MESTNQKFRAGNLEISFNSCFIDEGTSSERPSEFSDSATKYFLD